MNLLPMKNGLEVKIEGPRINMKYFIKTILSSEFTSLLFILIGLLRFMLNVSEYANQLEQPSLDPHGVAYKYNPPSQI